MDLVNDGTWEHSGEQLNFTSGWQADQPNNWSGPQDCTTLFMDGWCDRSCDFNIPFLCEINNWKCTQMNQYDPVNNPGRQISV